jgi:hypothetical protein
MVRRPAINTRPLVNGAAITTQNQCFLLFFFFLFLISPRHDPNSIYKQSILVYSYTFLLLCIIPHDGLITLLTNLVQPSAIASIVKYIQYTI